MKRGREIVPSFYYFPEEPMLDCSMYLLKNSDGSLILIDSGNGASWENTEKAIAALGLDPYKITDILITHEHLDHVLGLFKIFKRSSSQLPRIWAHPTTAQILNKGDEELICPSVLGLSASQFGVEIYPLQPSVPLMDRPLSLGDFEFDLYETPGHSLGSLTYFEKNLGILFPGDVVFPEGSFGRYDFPGGSLKKLKKSIELLSTLDVEILASGHMPPVVHNAKKNILYSLKNIQSLWW